MAALPSALILERMSGSSTQLARGLIMRASTAGMFSANHCCNWSMNNFGQDTYVKVTDCLDESGKRSDPEEEVCYSAFSENSVHTFSK